MVDAATASDAPRDAPRDAASDAPRNAASDATSCAASHAAFAMAQRFARGATMWCIAPRWPEHARHMAVEFVHPVIVGKRALPSVAVTDLALTAALRAVVQPGDLVAAVAPGRDEDVLDVMRRAPAWGATTVWIGGGAEPRTPADHLLWLPDATEHADADGSFVLLYHVLWELTHVCFEHPGLLRPVTDEVCVTCRDECRLAEVVAATGAEAVVRTAQGLERADVSLIDPVHPDDLVLVHAGAAIAVVEP
jgi:phosphoheptose isomerase